MFWTVTTQLVFDNGVQTASRLSLLTPIYTLLRPFLFVKDNLFVREQ